MNESSRRQFLAVSGASAVAVGAAAVVPVSMAGGAQSAGDGIDVEHGPDGLLEEGPMIASVEDLASGTVSVMHGEREYIVTDHELARRIARIARAEA